MTRFGVAWPWGDPNVTTHAQSIANTGVKEVRIPVPWADIETSQGRYDWRFLDNQVKIIRDHGLGILPVVYRTPAWHRPDRRDPPDPQVYSGFLCMVAEHLGAPVYEIWNEPNWPLPGAPGYPLDWKGTAEQYADLYRAARAALHGRFGDRFSALLGGLAYPNGITYLKSIWSRLGPVDSVGWHPYGLTVEGTWALLHQMADQLDYLGAPNCPIDVTEVGLPVGPGRPYTEKQRATYLKACAIKIKPWKRIRRWNVYCWHGEAEWSIAQASGAWKGGASGYAAGIKA